jgi:hypothetical protein
MDPSLQETILQAFTETQQWTQQFIVEDSGKLVNLASATIQQASTTPDHAQNHFKEHIRPTLPKKGMLLTEKGCEYG